MVNWALDSPLFLLFPRHSGLSPLTILYQRLKNYVQMFKWITRLFQVDGTIFIGNKRVPKRCHSLIFFKWTTICFYIALKQSLKIKYREDKIRVFINFCSFDFPPNTWDLLETSWSGRRGKEVVYSQSCYWSGPKQQNAVFLLLLNISYSKIAHCFNNDVLGTKPTSEKGDIHSKGDSDVRNVKMSKSFLF